MCSVQISSLLYGRRLLRLRREESIPAPRKTVDSLDLKAGRAKVWKCGRRLRETKALHNIRAVKNYQQTT